MAKIITVNDGNVAEGYKDYYIRSIIAMAVWKGKYPKLWVEAGGQSMVLDGREYFGGRFVIDSVADASKEKLLTYSGVDAAGLAQIRATYANDKVSHVTLGFKPHQTFTLSGLTWFMSQTVKPALEAAGSISFSFVYSTTESFQRAAPFTPYSFKASPQSQATSYIVSALGDADINVTLEALYRVTSWFESCGAVSTSITETINDIIDNTDPLLPITTHTYTYTTTTAITLSDMSYFSNSTMLLALFNTIHLGDSESNYYWASDSTGGVYVIDSTNYAGLLWGAEYKYSTTSTLWQSTFSDGGEGLVISHNGLYWIDKEKWMLTPPDFCLVTLGNLFNIGVDIKNGGFFSTFVGGFLKVFIAIIGMAVDVFGEFAYDVLWLGGLFILDIAASEGWISKKDLSSFKQVAKKVLGTVVLAVVTYGISSKIQSANLATAEATAAQTGTVEAYAAVAEIKASIAAGVSSFEVGAEVVNAMASGFQAYNTSLVPGISPLEVKDEKKKDPMMLVYEDRDENDIAEIFYDYIYDVNEPE